MTYRYYVPYQGTQGFGYFFIAREEPIDSEDAIRNAHEEIEKEVGAPVVILDWKRIY